MSSVSKKIPFKIELSRVLELLADQIYQSPLALLRENTQNAFDAIRMRMHLGQEFDPSISITVNSNQICVTDNGIGMTPAEIEKNFWYAGASGKNNDEARAAGVVGTFGIGAMANFGIADRLSVVTESARTGERTRSEVLKIELSTEKDSIEVTSLETTNAPGTIVTADLSQGKTVTEAECLAYLKQFVEFVQIPIKLNGQNISGAVYETALPSTRSSWEEEHVDLKLIGITTGDLRILGMSTGELRLIYSNIKLDGVPGSAGAIVLVQGGNAIRTFRTGFGLATVAVPSIYNWGGIVDLQFLQPTAGREALASESNQQLNQLLGALDQFVSECAMLHSESFQNDAFLNWIVSQQCFDQCGQLEVTVRPSGEQRPLAELVGMSVKPQFYSGRDQTVVATYASDDVPLIILSQRKPRRNAELGYLKLKGICEVDSSPRLLSEIDISSKSFAHTALATRVARLLEEDYFLPAKVKFGKMSGDLPLLVTEEGPPLLLYLDPTATSIAPLIALYRDEYNAFGPFVKDFVRVNVFPRISNLVPSSTREGAEAFLRRLQAKREWFEYELEDSRNLEEIWERFRAGEITLTEATDRLTDSNRSVVEVSRERVAPVSSIIIEEAESVIDQAADDFDPKPPLDRRTVRTPARILVSDNSFKGYGCFLSLSDRVQREKGDFFLQPHTTEIVWGGQKVLFIFQHHSRRFGLYYDILCPGLVSDTSGGGQFVTASILTQDSTFIPIPIDISDYFLPVANERKRLEIKCDVLYLDEASKQSPIGA